MLTKRAESFHEESNNIAKAQRWPGSRIPQKSTPPLEVLERLQLSLWLAPNADKRLQWSVLNFP